MSFVIEKTLTESAQRQLGKDYRVYLATREDGTDSNYVIFKGMNPIYDSKEFEAVAVQLQVLQKLEEGI